MCCLQGVLVVQVLHLLHVVQELRVHQKVQLDQEALQYLDFP